MTGLKNQLTAFIPAKEPAKGKAPKKAPKEAAAPAPVPQAAKPARVSIPTTDSDVLSLLSEYEILELKEAIPSGERLFVVQVDFDEANPMNTVGGIQVFAALKQNGQVLKTIPDFDALYEDVFHERVVYFISSTSDEAVILKSAQISDVTLGVSINAINLKAPAPSTPPAPPKREAAPKAESAPQAKPAPRETPHRITSYNVCYTKLLRTYRLTCLPPYAVKLNFSFGPLYDETSIPRSGFFL